MKVSITLGNEEGSDVLLELLNAEDEHNVWIKLFDSEDTIQALISIEELKHALRKISHK